MWDMARLAVVSPGHMTIEVLHICGLRAGLGVQLVVANDRT